MLTASLLWTEPTSTGIDNSAESGDALRTEALALLDGMVVGLQVRRSVAAP